MMENDKDRRLLSYITTIHLLFFQEAAWKQTAGTVNLLLIVLLFSLNWQ